MIDVEDEEDEGEKGSGEDQQRRIVRLSIGGGMRPLRAARAMLLAQLLASDLKTRCEDLSAAKRTSAIG
jgi:hypothetical protein